MAMSKKENDLIYMQGVSQGREELEDKVEGLEDMLEISDSIANSSQNNEKLWRSKFFKADNRIKELENKNIKLNEEVERWIDIHGLDVMQLAKKDKRIKELEADNEELWSQVT